MPSPGANRPSRRRSPPASWGGLRGPTDSTLSNREIEVLQLVARGTSNKGIARELWISETTVKTHMLHVFAKLGVADRTAAVTTALKRGIIRLEP